MVKAIIRKAAMSGMAETIADMMTLIKIDVAQRKPSTPSSPSRSHSVSQLRRRPHSFRHHKTRSKLNEEMQGSPIEPKKSKEANLSEQNSSIYTIIENSIGSLIGSISTFIEIVTKFSSSGMLGIVLTLSLICNVYLWIGMGYNVITPSITTEFPHSHKTNIALPAVYIRDLEEHVLNASSKALNGVDPIRLTKNKNVL